MSTELREYLASEIAEGKRNFKIGTIVMVVIVVLIIGYFQWLKAEVDEILQPDNLAELAVSEVRRNLPAASDALEKNLTQAAPEVIEFVMESVLSEALPMMTTAVGALFKDYSRELSSYGTLAAVKVFEEIVRDHKVELAKAMETAEPGFYTPDKVSEGLTRLIDAEMSKRINDRPEETVGMKLDESLKALHNINNRLKSMATNRNPNRQDELGRKLITTWWTFLNQGDMAEGPAADRMLDKSVRMPKTDNPDPSIPGDRTENVREKPDLGAGGSK